MKKRNHTNSRHNHVHVDFDYSTGLVKIRKIDDPVGDEAIQQLFFGKDNEAITEQVIHELVSKGWPEKDVLQFAKEGFTYCRPRNSFIEPHAHSGTVS